MAEGIRIARRWLCSIEDCDNSVTTAYMENNICQKHLEGAEYLICAECDYEVDFMLKSNVTFHLQHMENANIDGKVVHFLVEK